jgi:EmrB/QacA subfamily drug resistance transporter
VATELSAAQKRQILIAAILGSTVVFIDSTVVNVALPAVEDDLGGGLAGQQWTSNAYLVTLSALILIGGSLGDIFGERRIFSIGITGFALTSLLCAVAPTIEVLVVARALQGVFGALLTPAALALIVAAFPPEERGKAVGAWTAWAAIGMVLGPPIGGQLVDEASWRWIFAINLPLLALDFWLIRRVMAPTRVRPDRARVDVVGAVLCAAGLAGITFALIRQPEAGWGDPTVAIPLIGGSALFVAFLVYEARSSHPMLPLGLFRSRNFSVGNLETFTMYAGLSLLFFFLVLFLQQVAGYSATEAGSASLPVTVLTFLMSRRFGALADRYGPRLFMTIGPLVMAVGLALFTQLGADVDYLTDLLPALLVFGLGLSMTVSPLTAAVLAGADEQNAGIASGLNNAVARVAGLVAVAAVGAVVASSFGSALDDTLGDNPNPALVRAVEEAKQRPLSRVEPPPGLPAATQERLLSASEDASVEAFRVGLGISAALVAIGGLLGLGIRNPKREVKCRECSGGQLVGTPHDAARAADSAAAPA